MRVKKSIIILVVLFSFSLASFAYTEDSGKDLPSLDAFGSSLKKLVLTYYPKAAFRVDEHAINFRYDTRIFMVHDSLKTGVWQDAVQQEGPNKDGIFGDIRLVAGRYRGQAVVPQTFDCYYFKVFLLCAESSKYDCYLHVRVSQKFIDFLLR